MSHSPGEEGGLSQAAPNVNTQDLFDNPTETVATGSTPADQVGEGACVISVYGCNRQCCLSTSVSVKLWLREQFTAKSIIHIFLLT